MTYRSHTAAPSRVFDHLYDPIFTSSDSRNVYKEDCIALMRSAPIQIYPVLNSMFTEVPYEERNCYAYQKNVLPFNPSDASAASMRRKALCVTGADRSKFFKNPLNNVQTINVGLMANEYENIQYDNIAFGIKTTGIQTTYRESSAQTKPFLPECFTKEVNEVPEVAFIAEILSTTTYPGLKEIEIIERSRKRRQWETSLPSIQGIDDITSRATALEIFEWEEWISREKEINECQNARLKIVAECLLKREKNQKSSSERKIEHCKNRVLQERCRQKCLLLRKYQRNMRKLDLAQRKDQMGKRKVDVVLNHFDRKNNYTFPKIMVDVVGKKHQYHHIEYNDQLETKFDILEKKNNIVFDDFQGYLKTKKKSSLWKPKDKKNEIEKGIWNEAYLKNLHNTLKLFRFKNLTKRKIFKKHGLEFSQEESINNLIHQENQNSLLLQKTIKGCSIKKMMEEGIQNFRSTVEEAKREFSWFITTQKPINLELAQIEDCLRNDLALQEDLKNNGSKQTKSYITSLESELQRLQREKRAHALFILAERERYYREASKFVDKSQLDGKFKNDDVALYLENVLIEGIHSENRNISREFIRDIIHKIDRMASEPYFSQETRNLDLFDDVLNEQKNLQSARPNRESMRDFCTRQQFLLDNVHIEIFKDEFDMKEMEDQRKFCNEIISDIIAKICLSDNSLPHNNSERQDSLEAEELASEIVKKILEEIDNDFASDFVKSTELSSTDESGSSLDSKTEVLVEEVVKNVFIDILDDMK